MNEQPGRSSEPASKRTDALLESIDGAPVLAPADLAAAIVEAEHDARLDEISDALERKPPPKIPPRYESEIRTWLSRSFQASDLTRARVQAYAAVHLDPRNAEAIVALDDSSTAIGGSVRADTWSALGRSYPDVPAIRDAATAAGVTDLPSAAPSDRRRQRRKPTEAVLEDASPAPREQVPAKKPPAKPKPATGISAVVPALIPDRVAADRLALLHIVLGNSWDADADAGRQEAPPIDALTWAQRTLRGDETEAPPQAVGTIAAIEAIRGTGDRQGAYERALRRVKDHPAVAAWVARRLLDSGDLDAARAVRARVADMDPNSPYQQDLDAIDAEFRTLDDADSAWQAWQEGSLPNGMRARLARMLLADGREADADELLGLPELNADAVADERLLGVRYEVMLADGNLAGAIAQARRLQDVADDKRAALALLWRALALDGRLGELAESAESDCASAGLDPDEMLRSLVEWLNSEANSAIEPMRDSVIELRTLSQSLAKGRTIRDAETFDEATAKVGELLGGLRSRIDAVREIGPGDYAADVAAVVRFLAAGRGYSTEITTDHVTVRGEPLALDVSENAVVAQAMAPSVELAARIANLGDSFDAVASEIEAAVNESRREDIARRRVEERVSRHARAAADTLDAALVALGTRVDR